jgi:hypothetical protein
LGLPLIPPMVDPHERDHIDAADSYRVDQPVWVWRDGMWHPGTVRDTGAWALLVDYRRVGGRGGGTDTVQAQYVMARPDRPTEPQRYGRDPGEPL